MSSRRTLIVLSLLSMIGSSAVAQMDPEQIRVYFAPPDGTRFLRTTTIDKGVVLESSGELEPEEVRMQHEFKWRRTTRGYSLTMSPLRDSSLNAFARKQPGIAAAMLQNDLVINYDADGEFQAISGLDRAIDLTRKSLPPQFLFMLPDLKQGIEQLWDGRFSLARLTREKPAFVGAQWGGKFQMPFGSVGTIEFTGGGRVTGWEVFDGKRCLVIESRSISEDPRLAKMSELLDRMIREIVAMVPMPVPGETKRALADLISGEFSKLRLKSITEEGARAIDPTTYLTCKEQWTRAFVFDWMEGGVSTDQGAAIEIHTMDYLYR